MRSQTVKKQTRCKAQIKSFLSFYGIIIPDDMAERNWSKRFIEWLEELHFQRKSGKRALQILLDELKHLRDLIAQLDKEITALGNEDRYKEMVKLLKSIPGISTLTAMVLLTEIDDINRFKGLDELAAHFGLVPRDNTTGGEVNHPGISPRRNRFLRHLIIESAWVAVRKDPALIMSFQELTKRMEKNKAIIRIARKLLNRIRCVLKNQRPYQVCTVN
jgi:transposase